MDLRFANFPNAHHFQIDHQTNTFVAGNQYQISNMEEDLIRRLNPIPDASHTRNRKRSPPDSECFPGTREQPILEVIVWADREVMVYTTVCHIYWLHGFAGCGKSSISLQISKIYADSGRLLASYFFFRGAGDRSTMNRFAVTLASQLVSAIPAAAPFIGAAIKSAPGLLTGDVSLATQLDLLVFSPFLSVMKDDGFLAQTIAKGPYLIVIDGLDECEDKQGVKEFIGYVLDFFKENPTVPLRIFIASRVEQHIREHLETGGVRLVNLDTDHWTYWDIKKFLQASFQAAAKRDRIIRAYVREHGEWPTRLNLDNLIKKTGKSFLLASTMFKFIVQPMMEEDPTTPMDRLPLALEINGLDGLYTQTLSRSQNFPHFRNIISTIALLKVPLPIAGIAGLLGINTFEVLHVLLFLQAIINVPGTDERGDVTVCHRSLHDFLTTESRSGNFFVPPSFHLCLSYYCFSSIFEKRNLLAHRYGDSHLNNHWRSFAQTDFCNFMNEIEQFQSGNINRMSYPAFLCSLFFDSLLCGLPSTSDDFLHPLVDCLKQLARALERPEPDVRLWLEEKLVFRPPVGLRRGITDYTYETAQSDLRLASNAIRSRIPDLLEHQQKFSTSDKYIFLTNRFSGRDIFQVLQWIVAGAQFQWEEMKIIPRPPLELAISYSSKDSKLVLELTRPNQPSRATKRRKLVHTPTGD